MLERLCNRAEEAVKAGYNIIILSDRMVGPDRVPIPALLATAAVHHHLIRKGLRTSVGLVIETGEAREVHHFACLAGYGAEAIKPLSRLRNSGRPAQQRRSLRKSTTTKPASASSRLSASGLLKVMSKMGIFDLSVLLRRADLRRSRPQPDIRRQVFHGHRDTHRRRWPRRSCTRDIVSASRRFRRLAGISFDARRRRRIHVPHARRGAHWSPQSVVAVATCGARQFTRPVSRLCQDPQRAGRAPADHPWSFPDQECGRNRPQARCTRRSGKRRGDREALCHGRHVLRLDFARGAYDACDCHEPYRRQVEHGGRRRGSGFASSRWRMATRAAPQSSKWLRAASASRRNISSIPT